MRRYRSTAAPSGHTSTTAQQSGPSHHADERDEAGAVLILALVFLVAVSLIVTGLLTWVGTSLQESGKAGAFQTERNVEYAATNAMNLAIQNTRYSFDPYSLLDAASPTSCLSPAYPTGEGSSIAVYCTMVWQPNASDAYAANQNGYTRVITYSACLSGISATNCAAQPLLQAVVGFDDNPPGTVAPSINPTRCTPIASNGNCGESMTQLSWQWNPVVPTVSSISPASGSPAGGTTIQINGTGFIAGDTVNFLQESGGTPVDPTNDNGYNPPISATVVSTPPPTCAVPTCVEAVSPSVVSGASYFVTVTTPGGTSAFTAVFTYTLGTPPTVAGLAGSVTGGSVTGGNTVTIEGANFWAPSSGLPVLVFFCPDLTGNSCIASPSNTNDGVVVSPPQSGSSYATITALSPPVGGAGTYYIQVQAGNQSSQLSGVAAPLSGLAAPVFTYSVLVPIITSVTPQTPVAPGGSITIDGYNFVSGVTVGFCPKTNTSPYYNASCVAAGGNAGGSPVAVTPVSSTQIVVTVPNLGGASGTVYYPIVALPPYNGADQPGNPYNESADEFTYS